MARLKRCDLCGAEADELMSIDFPYEERWMLFFHKRSLAHYADLCLDCLEKIRAERQAQIKANEVDFEVADTPQTEETCERCVYVRGSQWCQGCNGTPKRWDGEKIVDTPQTDCETCKHYKLACELFSEVCKYEPITQTETQNSNSSFEKQTDCAWK